MTAAEIDVLEKALRQKMEVATGFKTPVDQALHLQKLFQDMDTDRDGKVSRKEFQAAMIRMNFVGVSRAVDGLFDRYDEDESGSLDYTEFLESLFGLKGMSVNPATRSIMEQFRYKIAQRGGLNGIRTLGRIFRHLDFNGNHRLNQEELKIALEEFGLEVADRHIKVLMDHFDKNHDGNVDFDEFLRGIRGRMNKRRRGLVGLAFAKLDKDGSGEVTLDEMSKVYDPSFHPEVKAGSMTPEQCLKEFMAQWDTIEKDGIATREEFEEYYNDVSASVDSDDYFELMLRNAWHISGGEGWCENTTNTRVLVTAADGAEHVEEVKDDIGVSRTDKAALEFKMKQQGLTGTVSLDSTAMKAENTKMGGASLQASAPSALRARLRAVPNFAATGPAPAPAAAAGPATPARAPPKSLALPAKPLSRPALTGQGNAPPVAQSKGPAITLTPTQAETIETFRKELRARLGVIGLRSLAIRFKSADVNGNKKLDLEELDLLFKQCGLIFKKETVANFLTCFDRDRDASLNYEEMLRFFRGGMSERRQHLVFTAYDLLDKNHDQKVTIEDLKRVYDASLDPQVIQGKKTADEVLSAMLAVFDEASPDGLVTKSDFLDYYSDISALIDDDDYFELMIRNAWHISGGQGWCENTSNIRVLATDKAGEQVVKELKDDLGVNRRDRAAVEAKLKSQDPSLTLSQEAPAQDKAKESGAKIPDKLASRLSKQPEVAPAAATTAAPNFWKTSSQAAFQRPVPRSISKKT